MCLQLNIYDMIEVLYTIKTCYLINFSNDVFFRSRYLGQVAVGVTIVASLTATGIVARIHHLTPILMG